MEPILSVVGMGAGNGKELGWTEGAAEGEGSEQWRLGEVAMDKSSCLRLPIGDDDVAPAGGEGDEETEGGMTNRLLLRTGKPQPHFSHLVPICCAQISRHNRLSSANDFQ
jgi:hypothetical protein